MQGEYRGDFTRDTFDKTKHFLRVLRQQGRVSLEADFNEQAAILLHYLQSLAADLIGPHGGPDDGFKIDRLMKDGNLVPNDFQIGAGRYYVDGILCENDTRQDAAGKPIDTTYLTQPNYPLDKNSDHDKLPQGSVLVYLDVWERHITYIEDDSIREVALGGPDTASRSKVVWQVKTTNWPPLGMLFPSAQMTDDGWRDWVDNNWPDWIVQWQPANCGMLKARVKPQDVSTDPCITSPESRYRGAENQLYRVEIHQGGKLGELEDPTPPSFKWSRENGSVIAAWLDKDGNDLIVAGVRDKVRGFAPRNWVELIDDEHELRGEPGTLVQLVNVDGDRLTIDMTTAIGPVDRTQFQSNPKVRRWDHREGDSKQGGLILSKGAGLIVESDNPDDGWLMLEDGVQIQFRKPGIGQQENHYRTGDYWLIPARIATGDVEWPKDNQGKPVSLPPHGIEHHYAPLWIISLGTDRQVTADENNDLRRKIEKIGE